MNTDSIDFKSLALEYGLPLAKGMVILLIGLWVIKFAMKLFRKVLDGKGLDLSLQSFLVSIVASVLKVLLGLTVLGTLGIEVTSFIAILGAAGLAVGMALSGTLQNFAGGVMILLLKPFKVGDLIMAQGHTGKVKEIKIFVTTLLSPDNKTILLPNGNLSNSDVTNFSTEGMIRVDLTIGISYSSDIKLTRTVLMEVMESHPEVMKTPPPFVGVSELADSSVNLSMRAFTEPDLYWKLHFDLRENAKLALDKAGIEIPFPQIDVHQKN